MQENYILRALNFRFSWGSMSPNPIVKLVQITHVKSCPPPPLYLDCEMRLIRVGGRIHKLSRWNKITCNSSSQGRGAVNKLVNQCRICRYFKTTTLVQRITSSDTILTAQTCRYWFSGTFVHQEWIPRSWEVFCLSIYVICNRLSTSGAHTHHDNRTLCISFDKEDVEKRQDWRDLVRQL